MGIGLRQSTLSSQALIRSSVVSPMYTEGQRVPVFSQGRFKQQCGMESVDTCRSAPAQSEQYIEVNRSGELFYWLTSRLSRSSISLRLIEVINLILEFTIPPHQIRRLWRHQGLRITARLGEDLESPRPPTNGEGWCRRVCNIGMMLDMVGIEGRTYADPQHDVSYDPLPSLTSSPEAKTEQTHT